MSNASHTVIRLEGMSKVFLTEEVETHALSNISFDISRGEFLSIAGPSGCGKTTLLSILGLLEAPTSGQYALNGTDVAGLSRTQRAIIRNQEIGFVFQSFNLVGSLTIRENVELPLMYRGMAKAERREKAMQALEKVDLAHRVNHYPRHLSGGQQQRAAVARAIVGDPSILLADEPTGNLDSKNGEAVIALLGKLNEGGATICMVTHDARYEALASRVIHLLDGEMMCAGHEAVREAAR